MTDRTYHVCSIRANDRVALCLWFTNARDGIERDEPGRIVSFSTMEEVRAYATLKGLHLSTEGVTEYHLDDVLTWCDDPQAETIGYGLFLDTWNLLVDVGLDSEAQSLFSGVQTNSDSLYDKLFWGSTIPSMTPPGEAFAPSWSEDDLERLAKVMRLGLRMLLEELGRPE